MSPKSAEKEGNYIFSSIEKLAPNRLKAEEGRFYILNLILMKMNPKSGGFGVLFFIKMKLKMLYLPLSTIGQFGAYFPTKLNSKCNIPLYRPSADFVFSFKLI